MQLGVITALLVDGVFRKHFRANWKLTWPILLSNLSLPLLGLADVGILGHLDDPQYLAAATVGTSLMNFIFSSCIFLSMGISGFTSQALGARRFTEIRAILQRYLLVATLVMLVLLLAAPGLIAAGLDFIAPPAGTAEQAEHYLYLRLWGVPAIVLTLVLRGFFVGMQNTRVTLYSVSITQGLNILLNLVLVFGFGLNLTGIAVGTIISEYAGLLLILWHLRRTLLASELRHSAGVWINRDWRAYRAIFQVSYRLLARSFLMLAAFIWFNRLAASFGENTLAANGILLAFVAAISHFMDGVAAAAEAQTGRYMGSKDYSTLGASWLASLMLNGLVTIGLMATFLLFGESLIALLTNQTEVAVLAYQQWQWLITLPLAAAFAFWADGVFIGAHRSQAMLHSLLFGTISFVALTLLLATTNSRLWLCFNLFFLARSLWLIYIFCSQLWPLVRRHRAD